MTLYTGVETGEPPAYIPKLGIFHSSEKEIAMKKTQKPFKCARCGIWNRWISKEMVLSQAKYGIKITGLAWSLGSIPVTIASFFLFPMNVEVVSALGKILLVTWVSWFLILGLVSLATYYSKDAQDIADTSEFIRFPKLRTFLIYILVNFGISILTASFLNGFSSSSNGMIPTIFTISTIVAFAFPFYLANKSNQSW